MRAPAGRALLLAAALGMAAGLALTPVLAGGPLSLCEPGRPFLWPDGGRNIPFNPDRGGLGLLDNTGAVSQTVAAFGLWEGVPSATAGYIQGPPLPEDVDPNNFLPYLLPAAPDGLNPIVYDADGSIFDLLFGAGSGILGFAGPEWVNPSSCEIVEGRAFFNGSVMFAGFPRGEFLTVQVHEFGHLTGLGHTVVNEEIAAFGDYTGPDPFDTFGFPVNLLGRIETMSPFIFINGGMATPHPDDVAILSTLYPEPDFASTTGSISGRIFTPNGVPVTGVNVIARNVNDPFDDAVSAISGDFAGDSSPLSPLAGTYTLNGLTHGRIYAVYVDQILAGGFSTPPASLPGDEEFWNGFNESSNSNTDFPWLYTQVPSVAGIPTRGIDIHFNSYPPGAIQLGLDDAERIYLPFPFEFCGKAYDFLYVNSNGSLTFGAPDLTYIETAADLLDGPPRIAPLWDDLNPGVGGDIIWTHTDEVVRFRFLFIPEFPSEGSNTFEARLILPGNKIELDYGGLTLRDGLAGLSCGGKATTGLETESDLTAMADASEDGTINARNQVALFEWFTDLDNDLSNRVLSFNAPRGFRDTFEPNDEPGKGRRISLPFDSTRWFTAIEPEGADVDFYRFRAREGETLVAEVVRGQMDSMLGLFDAGTGDLLALDDDGGQGRLSRLVFPVTGDGMYTVAVTTYQDGGFTGDGEGGGRYILRLRTVEGRALFLGDDDSIEVPFESFTFPFQGESWESVHVNSNGNLTFGQEDLDYTESVSDFLDGPPRIAPLWDDLSPAGGEQIRILQAPSSLTVIWDDVPEYSLPGGNDFSVTLHSTGEIAIAYGETTRGGGLVGITPGEGTPNPGPSDLSLSTVWPAGGTTYQRFLRAQFDLDLTTLLFMPSEGEPIRYGLRIRGGDGRGGTGPGCLVPARCPAPPR